MVDDSQLLLLVYSVMKKMNLYLPQDRQLNCQPEFVLFGDSGTLDSLGLANFIVGIEEVVESNLNCSLALSDHDFGTIFENNVVSVREFANFLNLRLQEKTNS